METKSFVNTRICSLLNARDPRGMDLLFRTYYKPLVSWANTFLNDLALAEDVVQEFFIDLWNGDIPGELKPDSLASFLRVLVRNRSLNRAKKRDVLTRYVELDKIDEIFEEYDDSKDKIIAAVMGEVEKLPPRSREILTGVFIDGLKYREVAERLNISVSTVKTLLNSAVDKLRERLNNKKFFSDILLFFRVRHKK